MDIFKRICYVLYIFVGIVCLGYVVETLLFKFEFDETFPSIYNNIFVAIICCGLWLFVLKGKELKKSDIYFLIILIILAIVVHFFVLNWHLKLIMLY